MTTATDVFALGVVLYELLTGTLPHDRQAAPPHELSSRVERETAERPSTAVKRDAGAKGAALERRRWARRLAGDLDTITMKALAHEPERRYPAAAALADDLRRYLTSRPVLARPDSRRYRLRKFVRRHRLVVTASAVVATALVAALAISLRQTATARREAERAAAAQRFLTGLFEQIDPRSSSGTPSVRDILERGSERLDRELADQPELRAEMHVLLGRVFDQLSLPDQGEAHWRQAVTTWQEQVGLDDVRTARAKKGLAISLARQARHAEADALFEELLERSVALDDETETASVLVNYGLHKQMAGDYAGSEALLERAVEMIESAKPLNDRTLAHALNNLGLTYWRQGREREAIPVIERGLAIMAKIDGRQAGSVAVALHNLAQLHHIVNELDAAERYGEEALAVERAVYPANHPMIANTLEALGQVASKRGDRTRARDLYEQSIAIYESSARPDHPDLAFTLRHLAKLSLEEGEAQEAIALYERALALRRKAFGEDHPLVVESVQDLEAATAAAGLAQG